MFEPRTPGFLHVDAPDPYRFASPDSSVSLGVAAANTLEQAILREGPDTVAAFIAEPVQGAGGVIVPPPDYFARIREICSKYDVLLISDDVITGFCRTGQWFGLEHYAVEPDIMQFAKGITSGYVPLGGVGVIYVTHRLNEVFRISQNVTVFRDGVNAGNFVTAQTDMKQLVTAIVESSSSARARSRPSRTS